MTKIAIIGAGLAGLSAARELRSVADITLFEKSRGVSGRMSTRYADPFQFDHGAQYFTARTSGFQALIENGLEAGCLARWDPNISLPPGMPVSAKPKYVGRPRMNSWLKHLSEGLDIRLGQRVERASDLSEYDWIISSAPAPQTLTIFPPDFEGAEVLKSVRYAPCFAVMLGLNAPLAFAFEAWRRPGNIASWIALNSAKPDRDTEPSLIIHGQAAWSSENVDGDRERLMADLIADASTTIGIDLDQLITQRAIHRWLYALVEHAVGEPFLIDENKRLAVCGDGCLGPRVEYAYQSGYALAQEIKRKLS